MRYQAILIATMAATSLFLTGMFANLAWAGADYRLGAGDKIAIHIYGQDSMDMTAVLGASGIIRYPFLGNIRAKGKTVGELEALITSGLRNGYLVNPQVRVRLKELRPFFVNGEVGSPGGLAYQEGLTLRKALAMAGGLRPTADPDKIYVVHGGDAREVKHYIGMDALIHPGDIITVEQSIFYIDGEVKKPGRYPLSDGMTFRMAVAIAGGFTERASEDYAFVRHENNRNRQDMKSGLDQKIQPGDVITIKQSFF